MFVRDAFLVIEEAIRIVALTTFDERYEVDDDIEKLKTLLNGELTTDSLNEMRKLLLKIGD